MTPESEIARLEGLLAEGSLAAWDPPQMHRVLASLLADAKALREAVNLLRDAREHVEDVVLLHAGGTTAPSVLTRIDALLAAHPEKPEPYWPRGRHHRPR